MKDFWIVFVSLAFSGIFVFGWLGIGAWENANPEQGENQARVDWLPENASDISYYRAYSWKAWEYSMNESDFREAATRYNLREITEEQVIPRYSWWTFRNTNNAKNYKDFFAEESKHYAKVRNGLFASERQADGGGFQLVFDRDQSRVYFQSNPR